MAMPDSTATDKTEADFSFLFERPLAAVLACLNDSEGETRVVGGAVRNAMMGLPLGDIDLASTLLPDAVTSRARAAGFKAIPTGIEHGTVTVVSETIPFEVTTLREDVQTYGRHAEVVFGTDWAKDASRRDFTMNALYLAADGTLHDPLGGAEDIAARRVRFIGDPAARIAEDYLRIVRFFRFQAGYAEGSPDAQLLSEIAKHLDGLTHVSAERIRAELCKMLPMPGALHSLEAMEQIGLLQALIGLEPQLDAFGRLVILERALPPPAPKTAWVLRLGAIAGPQAVESEVAAHLAARLRLSNAERDRMARFMEDLAEPLDPDMSEEVAKAAIYRLGNDAFLDRLSASWAVHQGGMMGAYAHLAALAMHWDPPEFPLSGKDIATTGIKPGPAIGAALQALEEAWINSGFELTRDDLLERLGHRLH
jgi:poly(A) polymerase